MLLSSLSEITSSPHYLSIIAMGGAVVPLILRDMEVTTDYWAPALTAITGHDPVHPSHYGNAKAIAADWIQWARCHRSI